MIKNIVNINKKIEIKNNKIYIINLFKENIKNKKLVEITGRIKNNFRDFGNILFFTINNFFFEIQCVSKNKENNSKLLKINNNSIIKIIGKIKKNNNKKKYNKKIDLFFSNIEIHIENFQLLTLSEKNIENFISNSLIEKASYNRYLMIRNKKIINLLEYKTQLYKLIHIFFNKRKFLYIDTPSLSFDTPEGSNSFIVKKKDEIIALSQSPQIYKEMLLLNSDVNFPGYYQIANCFRNEDLRADRQYEFKQLDIEIITDTTNKIFNLIEKFIKFIILKIFKRKDILFLKMSYQKCIDLYNTDKPNLESANIEIKIIKKDKNIIYFILDKKILFNHSFFNKIRKNFNIEKDKEKNYYMIEFNLLTSFKKKIQHYINLYNNHLKFIWIKDFPLFIKKDSEITYNHHPFVKPKKYNEFKEVLNNNKDIKKIDEQKLLSFNGECFDLVFKGNEILSGSLRISELKLQKQILYILNNNNIDKNYGFFLNSFRFAPLEIGGCAIGIDRLLINLLNYNSIKACNIFPRSKSGIDNLYIYK